MRFLLCIAVLSAILALLLLLHDASALDRPSTPGAAAKVATGRGMTSTDPPLRPLDYADARERPGHAFHLMDTKTSPTFKIWIHRPEADRFISER